MKKYIYKITNMINQKVYIGQTKNFKNRWYRHKSELKHNKHGNKHLQRAWNKYGKENFKFEVIDCVENYNEKEKEYIHQYNSDNYKFGYNIMKGGENPPIITGENCLLSNHTELEIKQLKCDLKYSSFTLSELAKKYNYDDVGSITRVNNGFMWRDNNEKYPLRECDLCDDTIDYIINQLIHTEKTQKEIGNELGLSRSTITMINIGKNGRRNSLEYPIRKINTRTNKRDKSYKEIIEYIIDNPEIPLNKIANIFCVSPSYITSINIGKRHKYNEYNYPIRK